MTGIDQILFSRVSLACETSLRPDLSASNFKLLDPQSLVCVRCVVSRSQISAFRVRLWLARLPVVCKVYNYIAIYVTLLLKGAFFLAGSQCLFTVTLLVIH